MKKTILLAAVAAVMSVNSFAQKENYDARWEQGIENRAERIADRMGLDDQTEEKFEADYKKMMLEHRNVMRAHRESMRNPEQPAKANKAGKKQKRQHMGDADAARQLQGMIEIRQKKLDLVKDYSKKMGKYLTEKQVLQVMAPMLRHDNGYSKHHGKKARMCTPESRCHHAQQGERYGCKMPRPVKK